MTNKRTIPTMTAEQRAQALEKAKAARTARAALKQDIADGKLDCAAAIAKAKDDPVLSRIRVRDLVSSFPGYGKAKTEAILDAAGVAENRRIGGLGPRQSEKLVELIG